ncbi:unnamed protein product [Cutaneotrichosporon oleaginosum]
MPVPPPTSLHGTVSSAEWSSGEEVKPLSTIPISVSPKTPRKGIQFNGNNHTPGSGRSAAGRLAGMQLRTPNKGEAARRAALSSPCYDASFATTPSQPSGRGTSSDRSDSRARTPGEIGSVTPKTPSTVRHYDSSCRTPQQEARYAALQAGLNPDRNFPRRAILRPRCEAALY